MRRAGWLLAVCIVVVGGLCAVGAQAAVPSKVGCASPKVAIKRFEVGASIGDLAIGPGGNVWFTLFDRDEIGRLTPRGKLKYFSKGITPDPRHAVTGSVAPLGITEGPDGNMWFTEYGADRIGRIAPDGTITEFSAGITPPSGAAAELDFASPHAIVAGPDGNLWFTEQSADRIGRITPDGVITEFAAGITSSPANDLYAGVPHQYQAVTPTNLTTGPDGNVWFVETMANRVGRITPDGTITEFAVPVDPTTFHFQGGSLGFRIIYLNGITPGSDGNVWFTADAAGDPIPGNSLASGNGAVGRITPSGEITLFAEGLSDGPIENTEGLPPNPQPAGLRGITEGPYKSFWALSSQGLVRVTRAGKITEIPLELEIQVRGDERLVPGPQGTLWFRDGSDLARATLSCARR